ncbi:MAG: acyl-[acyl-carrier-protein]--UDP-N-acetylglucosamine O-acyltransferase [Candidatus Wallbacteria bacterium GWC2_49_35]|uniref:Acyl-[acyl-carrier-protein]--UDP-N-acetylglucosamine O-acyltransferase n=1 Tax=Candidatus Wallbacteria bacterium GWC2_49_35 TaxID=1817813 RepID=A0A1F7WQM9_9BACT|nr:MAG: acyl-[acyl-carrier-protein]--UDP-N-acetylglucosamine O-acyltransferase [Candidatus Wallbacteria bacterium GWC2_49_35]HBC74470.1 acyl-[acyl-carrier-protein]--UDP-N-acetylglucosamine O-acyltransferase [Candidatus Wallbacteria bacterium]
MELIHKTAIIEPTAVIGKNCKIGAYSYVGPNVVMGDDNEVGMHAVIEGNTTIGRGNKFFTGAVIGSLPQDLKYAGEKSYLVVGDNNQFREYVDVNVAVGEGAKTIIGSGNLFMVYVHVAHNCVIHDRAVLANCATLAGHVTLENNVIVGGLAGVHQFVKVGTYAMIGGLSKITMDVMPYCTADGRDEIKICGLNTVGLTRAGFDKESVSALKKAYKIFFRSGLTKVEAVAKICETFDTSKFKLVSSFVEFAKTSERGILR